MRKSSQNNFSWAKTGRIKSTKCVIGIFAAEGHLISSNYCGFFELGRNCAEYLVEGLLVTSYQRLRPLDECPEFFPQPQRTFIWLIRRHNVSHLTANSSIDQLPGRNLNRPGTISLIANQFA